MTRKRCHLYTVHMKRIAASEVRRNWFRILDDVISGEVIVVERKGRSVILRCEDLEAEAETAPTD